MIKRIAIQNADVAAVFDTYPEEIKSKLLFLRRLIFDLAARTHGVGELEETLKWGRPSYRTTQTKSGSLARISHRIPTISLVYCFLNESSSLGNTHGYSSRSEYS